MAERDLDVVVFGATGVTGRRVAAYLAEQSARTGARWAAAARDRGKLERVLAEDGTAAPELLAAELSDAESLAAMASRARVVLDLAGPYTLYGRPVIEACVTNGAHYMDLSGEIPFVRDVIGEFDRRAAGAGVKVVQVAGFEALPPDLSVLLAAETARGRWGEALAEADVEIRTSGGPSGPPHPSDLLSGGTMQSMAEVAAADDARVALDPAALVEDPAVAEAVRARSPISVSPRRNSRGDVIAPMSPAAFINPPVIHRTEVLVAAAEGREAEPFRYREGIAIAGPPATIPLRYAAGGALAGIQAGFRAAARARPEIRQPLAAAMRRAFPSSGFGPKGDRVEQWRWALRVEARTAAGHQLRVTLEADGHPGYLTTARMLGEAGLLLAEEGATPDRSGCLTPAAALGTGSLPRFERARMRFALED